jgi:hypothetical protein
MIIRVFIFVLYFNYHALRLKFYLFSILNNTYAKIDNIFIIFLLKTYFNPINKQKS